jgi:hypothetical protein
MVCLLYERIIAEERGRCADGARDGFGRPTTDDRRPTTDDRRPTTDDRAERRSTGEAD